MINIRRLFLRAIENQGRALGTPTIKFDNRKIIATGPEQEVPNDLFYFLSDASGFYLSLPPNTVAMVIHPDGTVQPRTTGGLQEVRPGLYRVLYVDIHDRADSTQPVTEITLDGEMLTLRVLFRYRVVDPVIALGIERPVETLIEHLQTDLAQYIRTHNHNDIADHSNSQEAGKILQFFAQRHATRNRLSRAISIEGIELKEFTGDSEYVSMRRNTLTQQRQTQGEMDLLDRKNEIEKLKAEQKLEIERLIAKMSAETTAEKNKILRDTQKQDILIENMRTQTQRRHELMVKAVDAVGQAVEHSSYSRNPSEIKIAINNLLDAIKDNTPNLEQEIPKSGNTGVSAVPPRQPSSGNQKIEDLTNTLLNLLKPQK
jgi:hypothetical protein